MKNFVKIALVALTVGGAAKAQAEIAAPLWTCKLSALAKDSSISVLVGVVNIEGRGTVKCTSILGQRKERPVVVKILGVSAGPDISFPSGDASLKMRSAAIGLSSLNAIYGRYTLAAGVSGEVGSTKISLQRNVLTFTPDLPDGHLSTGLAIALQQGGQVGFGVEAYVSAMKIMTPAEARAERFREEQAVLEMMDRE